MFVITSLTTLQGLIIAFYLLLCTGLLSMELKQAKTTPFKGSHYIVSSLTVTHPGDVKTTSITTLYTERPDQ